MNKQKTVQQFEHILARLEDQCRQASDRPVFGRRFDRRLFNNEENTLAACLAEMRQHLVKLQQLEDGHQPAFCWLAEKLAEQCQGLSRELSTSQARKTLPQTEGHYWQQQYQQNSGYERRLRDKLAHQEQRLAQAETLQQQQAIAREITTTEQRLARCRAEVNRCHWQAALYR